jgi:hypothetical protein
MRKFYSNHDVALRQNGCCQQCTLTNRRKRRQSPSVARTRSTASATGAALAERGERLGDDLADYRAELLRVLDVLNTHE